MIRLPISLPPDLRVVIERELGLDISLSEFLTRLGPLLLRLFNAKDSIVVWHAPQCRTVAHAIVPATIDPELPQEQLTALSQRWTTGMLDATIRAHLAERLSCASFSAFSWPFGSLRLPTGVGRDLSIPRNYTLLIPLDSCLGVHDDADITFTGYVALFFEAFPQLNEIPVQLIVLLPGLLSELLSHLVPRELGAENPATTDKDAGSTLASTDPAIETAHELKRGVLFVLDQLEQLRPAIPAELSDVVMHMERNLQRMNRSVSRTLLNDRIDAGLLRVSPLDICVNEFVHEAVGHLAPLYRAAGVRLETNLDEQLPPSPLDPSLLPTVLENLLENAVKYSTACGQVTVRTRRGDNDLVILEVLDNGIGIPEDEWPFLFQKRFRASTSDRTPGYGLGLYLARRIVEAHHGTIMLMHGMNVTTAFQITFPTALQPNGEPPPPIQALDDEVIT